MKKSKRLEFDKPQKFDRSSKFLRQELERFDSAIGEFWDKQRPKRKTLQEIKPIKR